MICRLFLSVILCGALFAQTTPAPPVVVLHVLAEDSAVFSNLPEKPKLAPHVTLLVKPNDPDVAFIKVVFQGGNVPNAEMGWPVGNGLSKDGWLAFSGVLTLAAGTSVPGAFTASATLFKPTGAPIVVQIAR